MPDFWRNSGFHLLERDGAGRLTLTEDFLRAYLLRPEIRPIEESGPAERRLHESLLDSPGRTVDERELEAIEDADTRFNYRVLLDFFARLRRADSIEACYAATFAGGSVSVPPLFIDQLAQIIVRNVLDGVDDALEARAGELFFREQKASTEGGTVMLADLETIEMHASGAAYGTLGRLIVEAQAPLRSTGLDVLDEHNAATYWERDQRHDFVLAVTYGRAGLAALARLIARWVRHLVGVDVLVEPLRQIQDAQWAWHVGLDAQSTAILNDLWRGAEVDPGRMHQLLALFRLEFADAALMRRDVAGKPVYLALAMDDANVVRMKPQNLLINLPLAARS
jgi:hypothetical protein